jgi:hypothetical protein
MGLKTLSDHYAELGADFGGEIERRATDARLIMDTALRYNVPLEMLWNPGGRVLTPPPGRDSAAANKRMADPARGAALHRPVSPGVP